MACADILLDRSFSTVRGVVKTLLRRLFVVYQMIDIFHDKLDQTVVHDKKVNINGKAVLVDLRGMIGTPQLVRLQSVPAGWEVNHEIKSVYADFTREHRAYGARLRANCAGNNVARRKYPSLGRHNARKAMASYQVVVRRKGAKLESRHYELAQLRASLVDAATFYSSVPVNDVITMVAPLSH